MTHPFKRRSHSLYEGKYHIGFCPKYRFRVLKDDSAEYVQQQTYQLCQQKEGIDVLELNIHPDHVHLVVSLPPSTRGPNAGVFLKVNWRCGSCTNMSR